MNSVNWKTCKPSACASCSAGRQLHWVGICITGVHGRGPCQKSAGLYFGSVSRDSSAHGVARLRFYREATMLFVALYCLPVRMPIDSMAIWGRPRPALTLQSRARETRTLRGNDHLWYVCTLTPKYANRSGRNLRRSHQSEIVRVPNVVKMWPKSFLAHIFS